LVSAARAALEPAAIHPIDVLREDVARLCRTMAKRGASTVFAVAVADDGMHIASVDAKFGYERFLHNYADRVVGYYNSRVDSDTLLMDVLEEAHEIGLI